MTVATLTELMVVRARPWVTLDGAAAPVIQGVAQAAVTAEAHEDEAVMALTTDGPVPGEVIDEIASGEGFFDGRGVDL